MKESPSPRIFSYKPNGKPSPIKPAGDLANVPANIVAWGGKCR
jgi:hypothetical protein